MITKIIIGASYGDEGKGLATNYFANEKTLNILFNGGPQRGHTVELPFGIRHVFHHFGAGTFRNATTYFDKDFLVNPADFIREYDELVSMGYTPKVYVNSHCRVITLYDVMLNQMLELSKGDNRNGSCGMGIWECIERYNHPGFADFEALFHMNNEQRYEAIVNAQNYSITKSKKYSLNIPDQYASMFLVSKSSLMEHYLNDLNRMFSLVTIVEEPDYKEFIKQYDNVIWEGAQGLALDQDNKEEGEHVTASNTGSYIPVKRMEGIDTEIEIVYITRSYFTRHGAGVLPGECDKSEIGENIEDLTNVPNDYQKSIRYAKFNLVKLENRIINDIFNTTGKIDTVADISIFVTHLNETKNMIGDSSIEKFKKDCDMFTNIYLSDNKYGVIQNET